MNHIFKFRDAIAATGLVPPDENTIKRFLVKISIEGECWVWTAASFKNGYGKFAIGATRAAKEITYAHRASYRLFVAPIPPGMNICHRCDNPACVNPEHLFAATQLVNIRDCIEKGRARYKTGENKKIQGSLHGNSKITESIVREIRISKESNAEISKRLNMTGKHVWNIRSGKSWKHVVVDGGSV